MMMMMMKNILGSSPAEGPGGDVCLSQAHQGGRPVYQIIVGMIYMSKKIIALISSVCFFLKLPLATIK